MVESKLFTRQPGFEESAARLAFRQSIPLKTLVIYCPDPRAAGIPAAVAREFGEEWPGTLVRDASGAKVGSTTNIGQMISVGGRAVDALRSITTLNHMLGLEKVVVVHHSFCGLTAFTPAGLFRQFQADEGVDLHRAYDEASLTIEDFGQSLRYDVALLRAAPGVPRHIDLYGFAYDIDTDQLVKMIENPGAR